MDAPAAPQRIELVAVEREPRPQVRLRRGVAEAVVPIAAGSARLEAAAAATLEAVGRLIPPVVSFRLDEVHVITGPRPILVTVVAITVAGVPLAHTGSAIVGEEPELAAAKAALGAVNRRLEILGY